MRNPFRWNRLIFTRHEFTLLHASLRVCYGNALLLCESYRPFSNRRLYCVILSQCYTRLHKHTGKKSKLPCDETNVKKKQGTPKNILDSSTGFFLRECLLWSNCLLSPRKKQDFVSRTRRREERNPQRFLLFGPLKESKSSQNENFAAVGRMGLVFKNLFPSHPLHIIDSYLVFLYPP